MALTDLQLMAHLFRRAGFGAPRDELEAAVARRKEFSLVEVMLKRGETSHTLHRFVTGFKAARERMGKS